MTGPEDEQTDIIPALRADDDTAVDRLPPVGGARHRRPHGSRGRVVGVAAIVTAAAVVGYGTYTLRPSAPGQRVEVPPAAESGEPTTAEPSLSPLVRPSRTRADRHRSRKPSPSPSPTSPTPSPRQTPTSATPAPRLSTSPTVTRPATQSPGPSTSPSPSGTPFTSPSTSPKVSPS